MQRIWTAGDVLAWAARDFESRGMESPRLEAEVLLAHALSCRRIDLYTGFDRPLEPEDLAGFRGAVARRRSGEPSSYITGTREFWSLEIAVDPRVLVPRPDTEALVAAALDRISDGPVLDLGTGSGCVAVAIAIERPGIRVDAVDVSEGACAVAAGNAARHGVGDRVAVLPGDLFDPLDPAARYEAIVSNPPYVADSEIEALSEEVRREPRVALAGGGDGLDAVRRIVGGAGGFLAPGGWLLLEVDPRRAHEVAAEICPRLAGAAGEVLRDLAGRDRVVVVRVPGGG